MRVTWPRRVRPAGLAARLGLTVLATCQATTSTPGDVPAGAKGEPAPAPAAAVPAGEGRAAPGPAAAPAAAEAKAVFAQRCVMCHGLRGHGDGAVSASLSPKPRDYSDPAWQKATDDARIRAVILGGGPAIGKSAMMPGNPDLEGKPEVVEGLVQIVRAFGKA